MEYVAGQRSGEGSASVLRAWNSSGNACLGQEGSCFASWVEDTKVPINSAKQWHRSGVKLEDSPKALVSTALGGCGHFSNNTFPTLTSSYYKGRRYPTRLPGKKMVFTQLQTTTLYNFFQLLPANIVIITPAIATHPLVCRSSNHTTVTALQAPFIFV